MISMLRTYQKLKFRMQNTFPRYSDILQYLEILKLMYPNNVRLEKIGQSTQNRPIYMIVIQDCQSKPKNGIMIEAGIHAREWISHTTALYIVDTILSTKSLLDYMDFYIIPCVNPDGYEFTHTCCRLWRKNMNKNFSKCRSEWGVDLNRNFSFDFGGARSSEIPSEMTYKGIRHLSERESRNLANVITRYAKSIKLYISLHSYGELIMYPWGYTLEEPADVLDLHKCAANALECIKKQFPNSRFSVGQMSKVLYSASGITLDYVKKVHKIKFSYSIELPRGTTVGFIVHKLRILEIAREAFVGIESMVIYVVNYFKENPEIPQFYSNGRVRSSTHSEPLFYSERYRRIVARR